MVPTPGPVVIDGKLDEWDTSGEMFVYGVSKIRERYSVRVHAMWNSEALFLGMRFRDPSPLINNVDADGVPGDGWMADSFQGRFITDYAQVHLTAWYSSKKDESVAQLNYNSAVDQNGMRLFRGNGKVLQDGSGFEQAFVLDSDQRGYTQEMRLPWSLLFKAPDPKPGLKFGFTGEYFWGGPSGTTWPAVMWSDPINQANPVRIVIYQNPGVWGQCELLAAGNLPKVEPENSDLLLQGPMPLRFDLPAEATKFSLVVEDEDGRRVRNLASHANVSDYLTTRPTAGAAKSMIVVPWDGRADGQWNKDRQLFLGDIVEPGTYTVRGLWHSGVGVVHAGSFYDPGTPPWPTANGTGAWGFDHSNPLAVAAMPREATSKGRVFLGWHHGECGVGLIGLDASGRKIWEWLRRGTGATLIATSDKHVYFCFDGDGGRPMLARVDPDKGEQVPFSNGLLDIALPAKPTGLSVRNGQVAVSMESANMLLVLDQESGEKSKEIAVDQPRHVSWLDDSRVVALSGGKLTVITIASGEARLLVTSPEFKPSSLTTDKAGRLFVGDDATQTVALFEVAVSELKRIATIGEPGGHRPGPWNARRMRVPMAMAVEDRGDASSQVWMVENSFSPRRVSVWSPSGDFMHDYIGNTRYSASGGFLSDDIPDLGFVDGVSFRIDYANATYRPVEILGGQPDPSSDKTNLFSLGKGAGNFANPYHFFSNISGVEREYIVEAGGTSPMVFMKRGDRWQCVAAMGSASHGESLLLKAPSPTAVFSWNDLNNDGFQTADELAWHEVGQKNVLQGGWGYRCGRDLVFYHSGLAFRPTKFTADGAPIYDVTKAERLPGELGQVKGDILKTRFGYVADIGPGHDVDQFNVIHGLHQLCGFDSSGRRRWNYPNYWIAVHGAFTAPMAMPGVLMGTLKTTGVIGMGDSSVISLRGNIGQEFLIRDDGVYIGELFTDQRMAPATLPPDKHIVGLPINDTTLGGEPFNGWIGRQRDGKVRMTYGYTDVRIAEVTGLDRVQSLAPQSITLGAEQIAAAKSFVPKKGLAEQPTTYNVARGTAFPLGQPVDSELRIRLGREEVGRAKLNWDDQHLFLAVQASDTTPLQNKGNSAPLAFKTGDSVSLFVAPETATTGGSRILLTQLSGQMTAVVYRPQGPGNQPFVFESPVRTSPFQYVATEPAIRIAAQPTATDYTLTATIPWSILGVTPKPGLTLRTDLAILFSDDIGTATAQRVHWVDRETNVVNDTPTEAEFSPTRWGTMTLTE